MTVTTLIYAVDNQQAKSPNGALGLLVFLILAVAVVFLLRSMTKHLRKVERINFDEPPKTGDDASGTIPPPR
ncbi:MAG TPA: hypothetical protein VGD55_03915 [Acidothermaceae bacterium]